VNLPISICDGLLPCALIQSSKAPSLIPVEAALTKSPKLIPKNETNLESTAEPIRVIFTQLARNAGADFVDQTWQRDNPPKEYLWGCGAPAWSSSCCFWFLI
jgi:hypothetical protein